ncbi:MAG: hypothetical protein DDG58_10955 [Ardenticatenia bacterium]|jgi:hypothetical protein|nr:MAG: hypothetical protein DDG58_10955 [Ardenticatenia bacterium]
MPSPKRTRRATPPAEPDAAIREVVADALRRLHQLGAYLDAHQEALSTAELARLFSVHGENAARIGRLLRDARALSGDAADGLLDAVGKALDEIATQWGVEL